MVSSETGHAHLSRRASTSRHRTGMLVACAIVFLSPFNVLRVPGVFFTASDVATLLAFLVLMLNGRLSLTPFGRFSIIWYAGTIALTGGLLIGSVVNQGAVQGAEILAQYFFALVVVPIAIGHRTTEECLTLIGVFVASMVVVCLHGIYLIEFASNPPANFVSGSGRLRGVVERSNEAAALGAVALVAAIYLAAEGRLPRLLAFPAIGVILYGITLTASNTGFFAGAAGIATFTVLQGSGRHFINLAVLAGLTILALVVFGTDILPSAFMNRVAGALTSADISQAGTFDGRLELSREGWYMAQDHLLVGLGAGMFREVSIHRAPVHNTYILVLVEGGVLALVGLVTVFSGPALLGLGLMHHRRKRTRGAFIVATAVIFLLMLNAFAHVFARFWIVPVVLVTALAVSSGAQRPNEINPLRKE